MPATQDKPKAFTCYDCNHLKPIQTQGGTGYALFTDDEEGTGPMYKVCYKCCAERDRQWMKDKGVISLYLQHKDKESKHIPTHVSNWPDTLSFRIRSFRTSWHNFAGSDGRTDVWFEFEGYLWHGVCIGDMDITRCRQTKKRSNI